jgi:hypothetical protein
LDSGHCGARFSGPVEGLAAALEVRAGGKVPSGAGHDDRPNVLG